MAVKTERESIIMDAFMRTWRGRPRVPGKFTSSYQCTPMNILYSLLALPFLLPALAAPAYNASIRPVVIWHGLGDSYASPGMLEFADLVREVHPGIFVHNIYIDEKLDNDRQAGFYGDVNEQIDIVAAQLRNITELKDGFDAIGFSQGGQFLRAYQQRYGSPPIHNLIAFGSQHMGISDLPLCKRTDLACQLARRAVKSSVYGDYAQKHLIQAQYFRDPAQLPAYLASSRFLADINNERSDARNSTYAENIRALNALVLVLFQKDVTVVPKESSWFGSEAPPDDDDDASSLVPSHSSSDTSGMDFSSLASTLSLADPADSSVDQTRWTSTDQVPLSSPGSKTIIPLRLQPLYTQDWLGLRSLDKRGGIVLGTCPGAHMELTGCWDDFVKEWCGSTIVPNE
ncbi:hypothetical protein PLICRDRAFT_37259 [Plicaturopsis crispa FD-325 SS-3]|nr:hypothetical protein PLICRDRAFT_37259 [Plicaturopsis crispa FD-325 SS-3]